ncbi:MAG: hypothetical protein ACW97P_11685 [Candidatus Hodarchaeales archaeon]|jgi:uncharacterized protein involved in cysteine biosynthesis
MDLLKSKKFQAALAGVIVVVVISFIPEIDETALTEIVALIIAYIVGQGLADFGKEANK